MPFISAWFHMVWATKCRFPYLTDEIRYQVFDHIRENAKEKEIYLDCINGHDDHVHCLISLSCEQTISKVIQLIKGESAHWINKHKITATKFEWQDDYFATSVSPSRIQNVRNYICGQEAHHRKKTFQEEYDMMIAPIGPGSLVQR